jgi:hypothetical protein
MRHLLRRLLLALLFGGLTWGCASTTEEVSTGCHPFTVWLFNAEHTDSVATQGCYCVQYNWQPPATCEAP